MKGTFEKSDARILRDIYNRRANEIDPNGDAVIALSGGTDSISLLFAEIENGRKPDCFTFYMDGIISEDLKASRHACNYFGLKLHEVAIPTDIDIMYADIKRVLPYCEYVKKTIIQCMIPWLYIYPQMGEKHLILNGLGGDDYFGTQRKVAVAYHNGGDEACKPYRKWYGHDLNFSEANIIRFARQYGKENIDFYGSQEIEDFLLQYTYKAINSPFMKYASVAAYRDFYDREPFYRDLTEHSYQINSKLKGCHDRLLLSKYNTKRHKSIIGLYNEIARSV